MAKVAKAKLFDAWQPWSAEPGLEPGDEAQFGRALLAAMPTVSASKRRVGETRQPHYKGISLVDGKYESQPVATGLGNDGSVGLPAEASTG